MSQLLDNGKDDFSLHFKSFGGSYQEYHFGVCKVLQHGFKLSFKRGDPATAWHFRYDNGVFLLFVFCHFQHLNLSCSNSLKHGANGERTWLTERSLVGPRASHGLHLLCRTLGLPPVSAVRLSTVPWGLTWEHQETKDPIPLDTEQSGFFPKPDFQSWNAISTALMGVLPDKSSVTSYFTAGMQTVHLQKFFFLFAVNSVLYQD